MKYAKLKIDNGYEHTFRIDNIKYVRQTHHNQVRLMIGSDFNQQDEVIIQVSETGSGDSALYALKDSFVKEFVRMMSGKSTLSELNLKQADGTPYTLHSIIVG